MGNVSGQIQSYLARIAERDDEVGAWAHVNAEAALALADRYDAIPPVGPLHGLAIGIKDVIATSDMPTRYNCALYRQNAPTADAACVALLRQAGAIILGKTETVELASVGAPPRTRNPHDLTRTPGGSSSGSGAAVADGQVQLALGTQTGGSIIRPASYCGVWALKPSWGSVSTEGAKPFAPSLDTIGWFGQSVGDLELLFDALTSGEAMAGPLVGRIGVWRTGWWHKAEAATRSVLDTAISQLRRVGIVVEDVSLPLDDLADVHMTVMRGEGRRSFLAAVCASEASIHPRIVDMVKNGPTNFSIAYDRAAEARRVFESAAMSYDAILSPSTTGEAPVGLDFTGDLIFNGVLTLLQAPCINLPLWRGPSGLPVGLTISAVRGRDRHLLRVASTIDKMLSKYQID